MALRVAANGPADRAGIRVNDILESIQGAAVSETSDVPRRLANPGAWAKAAYMVRRAGVDVPVTVIVGEAARGIAISYQYLVGVAYLAIGLFVYFRRGSAYKARHFYIFCLVSFVVYSFHYTGKLNGFDTVIYWGNLISGWLAPALFLHFCLTFPEPRLWYRRWVAPLIYLPGAILTAVAIAFAFGLVVAPGRLGARRPRGPGPLVDRAADLHLLLLSAGVLQAGYREAEDPVIRQQLKWLRNGMVFGFTPFGILYAIPYVADVPLSPYMNYAVVTLPLIPLTIAYAIVRYRLMDVDVIFCRGYAYTLATLGVLAAFYALVFSLGSAVQKNFKDLSSAWLIFVMLLAAFIFQPLRNWIQGKLDQYFYRDRYNYRRTLIEFARELNSETDLDSMLQSVSDRLMQTLSIRHVAFFLAEAPDAPAADAGARYKCGRAVFGWKLRMSMGSSARPLNSPGSLDLGFLNWPERGPYIFFERTRYHLDAIGGKLAALRSAKRLQIWI